jgi:hypothetical protein
MEGRGMKGEGGGEAFLGPGCGRGKGRDYYDRFGLLVVIAHLRARQACTVQRLSLSPAIAIRVFFFFFFFFFHVPPSTFLLYLLI